MKSLPTENTTPTRGRRKPRGEPASTKHQHRPLHNPTSSTRPTHERPAGGTIRAARATAPRPPRPDCPDAALTLPRRRPDAAPTPPRRHPGPFPAACSSPGTHALNRTTARARRFVLSGLAARTLPLSPCPALVPPSSRSRVRVRVRVPFPPSPRLPVSPSSLLLPARLLAWLSLSVCERRSRRQRSRRGACFVSQPVATCAPGQARLVPPLVPHCRGRPALVACHPSLLLPLPPALPRPSRLAAVQDDGEEDICPPPAKTTTSDESRASLSRTQTAPHLGRRPSSAFLYRHAKEHIPDAGLGERCASPRFRPTLPCFRPSAADKVERRACTSTHPLRLNPIRHYDQEGRDQRRRQPPPPSSGSPVAQPPLPSLWAPKRAGALPCRR